MIWKTSRQRCCLCLGCPGWGGSRRFHQRWRFRRSENFLGLDFSDLLYQLRILWMSSSSWLILCRKSPCLRKNNMLLIIQRPWDLIWKRSLDLNIWIVSLWSILVTSMSGHCKQELRLREEFSTFCWLSSKVLLSPSCRSRRCPWWKTAQRDSVQEFVSHLWRCSRPPERNSKWIQIFSNNS